MGLKNYIHRALEQRILAASAQFPVLLLTGPRQTGKTTLLMRLKDEKRAYVSLDSMPARLLAREDPELFLQRYAPPVIIDEIQYAPELLSAIKLSCDAKQEKGMFWITGSQQFQLMRGVTESLAGRVAIVSLNGLSDRELSGAETGDAPFLPLAIIQRQKGRAYDEPTMFGRMFKGSYPAVLSGEVTDTDLFYSSYVQTYLERDLRELSHVGDLETFYTFLKVLAARTATAINMSELSRDCAISVPTVKHWISVLVATSLVYLLKPYASNRGSRLIKSPKLYFLDTGLCAYLAGYSSHQTLAAGPLRGAIFETWCVSEVLKSWWYALKEPPLFYYRDKECAEIDLLFESDGSLYPAEIKLGVSPKKDWIRHFPVLQKLGLPIKPGNVLCLVHEPFPIDRGNIALPAGWI
jgi:predicted AAA+ superfamily ATPase